MVALFSIRFFKLNNGASKVFVMRPTAQKYVGGTIKEVCLGSHIKIEGEYIFDGSRPWSFLVMKATTVAVAFVSS